MNGQTPLLATMATALALVLVPFSSAPAAQPPNTLVNNPNADSTNQDSQLGTSLVLGAGGTIICAFNDSGSNAGGQPHFTGFARSTNSGNTWTDLGTLPNSAAGDLGFQTLARSNATGTIVMATIAYNSTSVIQTFRSIDDGVSFQAPIDGDGGGTNNDKPFLACDNFAGAGQGNFYLFYRDFGGGGGMSLTRSIDDGVTWSPRQVLTAATGQGPWVVVGADHAVYCFYLIPGNQLVMRKSTDLGVSFGPQTTVATLRTSVVNGDLGLNGGFRTNSFIQVVANPTSANQLFAVWNDKGISPSTDKANVYFAQSINGGASWSTPVQVNTDSGTNDNFLPVIAITPDGMALFVSWYDRRLDPANTAIDVFGRNATVSGGTVSFGPDYPITDMSFPVVVAQDSSLIPTVMLEYDTAVADATTFYRTWTDTRLPRLAHAHQPDVRFTKIPKAGPGPIMAPAGTAIIGESCTVDNAIEPSERVTINFSLTNVGTAGTTNLVATLLPTGGVAAPSGPQSYGTLSVGAPGVARSFSLNANGTCGGTITATFQLQDGATDLGTVSYTLPVGTIPIQTFSNSSPITINDNAAATPYPSAISVTGVTSYSRIAVTLHGFAHSFPADVDIILVAPGGQTAYVMSDVGDNGEVSGLTLTFDDAAAMGVGLGSLLSGTFKPSDIDDGPENMPGPAPAGPYATTFAGFAGLGAAANGTWSLFVRDDVGVDMGSITGGWSISFIGDPVCDEVCGLKILDVTRVPPDLSILFQANAGNTYRLERKTSLTNPIWNSDPAMDINATTTGPTSFLIPNATSMPREFYRVRLLP